MLKKMTVLLSLCFLAACEPGFIVDETTYYAEQIGIIDDYNIQRSHNYVFSKSSRFAVTALDAELSFQQSLVQGAEQAFANYFSTTPVYQGQNQRQVLGLARDTGANFLAVIRAVNKSYQKDVDGNTTTAFRSVDLVIDIYDVNSGHSADKVTVTARKSRLPIIAGELPEILYEPLRAVAKELAGES